MNTWDFQGWDGTSNVDDNLEVSEKVPRTERSVTEGRCSPISVTQTGLYRWRGPIIVSRG